MAEIGKITPAYHNGEQIRQWRVPVTTFLEPEMTELDVTAIYEDEGFFCIDVKLPEGYKLVKS